MHSMNLPRTAVVSVVWLSLSLSAVATSGCDKKSDAPAQPTAPDPQRPSGPADNAAPAPKARAFDPGQLANFQPLPAKIERPDNLLTEEKVALGRMLWFDARLSKGQDVSCNTCHDVAKSGADANALSTGTKKQKGTRNAPTIFNAAGGTAQGWDGRATLVEELALPHAAQASVMGLEEKALVETVSSISVYVAAFKKSFPDAKASITAETVSMAIAAYTRKLLTPSRWDEFLAGDQSKLTDDEKAGLGAFLDANCMTCHAGKYMGASQNQKLGVAKPWPASPATADLGRFDITKQDIDRNVFKVPSLRNVVKTGPYLHDGSIASLEELTKLMARHQVGKDLTDAQAKSIVTFLGALSGEPPKDLVTKPDLPPSGPKTRKPE